MASHSESPQPTRLWLRRTGMALIWAAVIFLLVYVGSAFLPRWWSHRVAGQVHGSITLGVILGLFYGFVFTMLPLLVVRWLVLRRRSLRVWVISVALALLLAGPNLLTLGIVLGRGNAAHAGERTLDVDAPAFRGSSLAGALIAVAAFVLAEYLLISRRRGRRELKEAHRQMEAEDEPSA